MSLIKPGKHHPFSEEMQPLFEKDLPGHSNSEVIY